MSVRLLEIDYAYWAGDSAKAQNLLDQIDERNLKTVDEMVNVANFRIKEKRYEDALRLLAKANAIDPGNFVILYNLGVCSYSFSEYFFNLQNQMALHQGDKSEIEVLKSESDKYLNEAAGYFEQARQLQPDDLNLLNTLRAIYVRQQSPKADEIDKVIKQMGN